MNKNNGQKRLKSTRFDELGKPLDLGRYKVHKNRKTSSGYIAKFVLLPKIWADSNEIQVGDEVEFIMERNGTLSMRKVREAVP